MNIDYQFGPQNPLKYLFKKKKKAQNPGMYNPLFNGYNYSNLNTTDRPNQSGFSHWLIGNIERIFLFI